MPLFEGKTPQERYKTIAALALGIIALLFIGRMFFGSSKPTPTRNANSNRGRTGTPANGSAQGTSDEIPFPREIPEIKVSYDGAGGSRNIFAFYEPPVKKPTDTVVVIDTPTPTPTPPPPLTLSGAAPASVFARAEGFTLTLTGDKFTPQVRIYVDSEELPTTYAGEQQLTANVPAALISAPGTRTLMVRTPDGQLYSNPLTLSVAEPPRPQYTYIGLLGGPRYNDKAMLKGQTNDVVSVQRGDIVGGRFKVTSISERAVDFMDTQLKIKHTLPYVEARAGAPGGPRPYVPPPPRPDDDDTDEPQL